MNNAVHVSDLGNYVTVTAAFRDFGGEDGARAAAVRAAHDHVFADGRTAEVSTALGGRFGGAIVDSVVVVVRYA